jgi:sugar/nucleoside kinase (ribokinase family)
LNSAHTEAVELNVLAEQPPVVPESYENVGYVFLANTAPSLQMKLLDQLGSPSFVAADTMNLWITTAKEDLKMMLDRIDMLIINEGEAKLLTGHRNLITAAKAILEMGPRVVIIKKGEYGSMMMTIEGDCFLLPAYPTSVVIDPTGAGDSFAGGLMGYLASAGRVDVITLRNAMVYGTVVASYTIGDFSVYGIRNVTRAMVDDRFDQLRKFTQF